MHKRNSRGASPNHNSTNEAWSRARNVRNALEYLRGTNLGRLFPLPGEGAHPDAWPTVPSSLGLAVPNGGRSLQKPRSRGKALRRGLRESLDRNKRGISRRAAFASNTT